MNMSKRIIVRCMTFTLISIALLVLLPLASPLVALLISTTVDCSIGTIDYSPPPCIILGADISETLEILAYFPFFYGIHIAIFVVTAFAIWCVLALALWMVSLFRRSSSPEAGH